MKRAPDVLWAFHGTIAVNSYQQTLDWLNRLVGCVALEFTDAPPPVARIGGCCWLADGMLEIAEPNDPSTPTAKFLQRFGPGYLNLALQLDDLGEAGSWFTERGAAPTVPVENHFTFTRPSETCGLQFEWADFKGLDWDPRHGAPRPQNAPALIDAQRIAYWGALVSDPRQAVSRLNQLCSMPLILENFDAPPSEPAAAFSVGDGTLALFRLPADGEELMRLWGSSVAKPRFHVMAFRVRDLAAAISVFERENIRTLRGNASAGTVVTDPEDTLGLCLAWTDQDIIGDPRGAL